MPLRQSNLLPLWDGRVIRLPTRLCDIYRGMLERLGFLDQAIAGFEGRGPTGGQSDQETNEHFTHRFGVGGGRIQYVIVSSNDSFKQVARDLLSAISGGNICLLDLPCGAGTSSSTFLSLLSELRSSRVLPTVPLNVSVIGADFSPRALALFNDLMSGLAPVLAQQSIRIQAETIDWDATRSDSTAVMMNKVLDDSRFIPDEYIVLITNFSGEASRPAFFREFSPCLEQILGRLSTKPHTIVWLEPSMSGAEDLLSRLRTFFTQRIPWISSDDGTTDVTALYDAEHPIKGSIHPSNVKLLRHVRR